MAAFFYKAKATGQIAKMVKGHEIVQASYCSDTLGPKQDS